MQREFNRKFGYAKEPRYLFSFGSSGTDHGQLEGPRDVAVSPTGEIYIADDNGLHVFDGASGVFRRKWDGVLRPRGVVFDPDGRLLVSDRGHKCVLVFQPDGVLLRRFAQLSWAYRMCLHKGLVYVCDAFDGQKICVFTLAGEAVRAIAMPEPVGQCAVSEQGEIFVDLRDKLCVFDQRGQKVREWPRRRESGRLPAGLGSCVVTGDLQFDGAGHLWVAGTRTIDIFTTQGRRVRTWCPSESAQVANVWPDRLLLTHDSRIIVHDCITDSILVFAY